MGKFSVLVFFSYFCGFLGVGFPVITNLPHFSSPWTLPNVSVSSTLAPRAASTLNYISCENVENPCPLLLPNLFFQRTKICQEIREFFFWNNSIVIFSNFEKEPIRRLCLCGSGKQRFFLGGGRAKFLPNMIIINNRGIFCHNIPFLKKILQN